MVEVLIEEMYGSGRNRPPDYERALVVNQALPKKPSKTTLRSERTSARKPSLMSGLLANNLCKRSLSSLTPAAISSLEILVFICTIWRTSKLR